MKCCYNPENYLCGTKTDAVFNVYKNYGEKFGGGYVKNYQLNYYSKILFDFNAHVSSPTGPIMNSSPQNLEIIDVLPTPESPIITILKI